MKEESICLEHQIAMITYFVFLSFTPLPSLDPSRHILFSSCCVFVLLLNSSRVFSFHVAMMYYFVDDEKE